jgi:hypothetical protein
LPSAQETSNSDLFEVLQKIHAFKENGQGGKCRKRSLSGKLFKLLVWFLMLQEINQTKIMDKLSRGQIYILRVNAKN